jgi:ribonucleoside-diphosphate reductase alpha chain
MTEIGAQIWRDKYRFPGGNGIPEDRAIQDTWRRVARGLAAVEADPDTWEPRFLAALEGFRFLPAGRILSGIGTGRSVTLMNCFVMGDIPDSMEGIFEELKRSARVMQTGGGIGVDFSSLRPKGARVKSVGADSSGPLPFMDTWDAMCRTVMSAGSRRGAMMATMRCDHPDIEAFIEAKREPGRLRMFNLSVLVTDAFMRAVKEGAPWELNFGGAVHKILPARDLWDRIMRNAHAHAEPGVIFIDRINRLNNLSYCETIRATNPCGEAPLPPYGSCCLGSVNLAALVLDPYTARARIDESELADLVAVAVRMLDDVIEASLYPLPEQEEEAKAKRRIGLGVTGLADALAMCGARYGGTASLRLVDAWLGRIKEAAYAASAGLAAEKGAFPLCDAARILEVPLVAALPEEIREAIGRHGLRNGLLTSIAPTGTISLLAGNVSSGLEPVFAAEYGRAILEPDGSRRQVTIRDHALEVHRRLHGPADASPPSSFVTVADLTPDDHLAVMAAAQRHVDAAISKTVNLPEDISFEAFKDIYRRAYDQGCKGCTTYRPNEVTGSVLTAAAPAKTQAEPELPGMPAGPAGDVTGGVVQSLFRPLDRPEAIPGQTYKVRWPESDHAIYITVNDIVDDQGRRRPFEIFINSKNMEHFAWTVALTRMISAVFRRGGDVAFVVDELKAVFDPRGGQWMGGRYVPSLLAAIGEVIERHMTDIGFLRGPEGLGGETEAEILPVAVGAEDRPRALGRQCPKCGQATLIRQEGCDTCTSCGHSKCG